MPPRPVSLMTILLGLFGLVVSAGELPPEVAAVGVNLAGAEFGSLPGVAGKDYTYPGPAQFDYCKATGLTVVRLPLKWERLQPALNGPLTEAELGRLDQAVRLAGERGLKILLDVHNFDRDHSGTYQETFDDSGAHARTGVERLRPFAEWLKEHNARGFIGEFGVPDDDPRWLEVMDVKAYHSDEAKYQAVFPVGDAWQDLVIPFDALRGDDGTFDPSSKLLKLELQPPPISKAAACIWVNSNWQRRDAQNNGVGGTRSIADALSRAVEGSMAPIRAEIATKTRPLAAGTQGGCLRSMPESLKPTRDGV